MLCVRCKHELPPRADRCLRCFALNPQNRAEMPAAPQPAGAAAQGRPAGLSIDSEPAAASALSIASDPPAPGGAALAFGSEPPPAAVALDFSSEPGPPDAPLPDLASDPPLSAPPLGLPADTLQRPRRPASRRSAADALERSPAFRMRSDPPKRGARFDEIPGDEIDELQIAAREPSFYTAATEPPSAPPPDSAPVSGDEERLRERLRQAASDHDWGAPPPPPQPFRPPPFAANAPPFLSPLPPQQAPPVETTPGWVAALATDPSFPTPAPAGPPQPRDDREDTLRELVPAGARAAPGQRFSLGDEDSVPVAPPVSLPDGLRAAAAPSPPPPPPPAADAAPARSPAPPPAARSPAPPALARPAGPQRPAARALLASWLLDAAAIAACCALFVALTAALLGRARLAPLGDQSLDSWADQLLFGRRLPLFWGLLALALGVAYSWLFGALGGRTPGQRLAGLRLRRLDGGLPDPVQALAHAALALPSLVLGLFGFLLAFVDPRRQTLHDKLSGVVVEVAPAAGRA